MPLAKCIVNDGTKSRVYYPLSAVVKLEGNKKPDTLEATFTAQNKVKENYEICYIQDVVDTTYLRAVYPMQLSCLDESGNNLDPTDPAETRFVNVTTGKFKGHYALDFTADGQGVSVPDPRAFVDISKQFDIHVWFTPDTTQLQDGGDEPILWNFRDRADPRGIEFGITGTNGNNASWKAFLRESNGSLTNAYIGSDTGLIMTGSPVHMRVKRGDDNLLQVYVNGVLQISESKSFDYQPTVATPMVFGDTDNSTADEFIGQIHEIKIYCGATLSDRDAEKVRWTKPVAQYMKFAGRIRKLTSNQTSKKAICQSNSYELTTAKLENDLVGTAFSTGFKTIAQNAVDNSLTPGSAGFNVRVLDSFAQVVAVHTLTGNIFEVGSVTEFLKVLLLYGDMIMYVTPRRNIIIETGSTLEPSAGKLTDYIFDQNGTNVRYDIKGTENSDTKLINQAIVTGRSPATNQEYSFTPTDSIRRTLRRNFLQIDNSNNLDELAIKTVQDLGNIGGGGGEVGQSRTKYVIQTIAPIHHVKYNHVVRVKRKMGANAVEVPAEDIDLDEDMIVTQIEHHYPSGKTVIKVGENDIDFFDDRVEVSRTADSLIDTTL